MTVNFNEPNTDINHGDQGELKQLAVNPQYFTNNIRDALMHFVSDQTRAVINQLNLGRFT